MGQSCLLLVSLFSVKLPIQLIAGSLLQKLTDFVTLESIASELSVATLLHLNHPEVLWVYEAIITLIAVELGEPYFNFNQLCLNL